VQVFVQGSLAYGASGSETSKEGAQLSKPGLLWGKFQVGEVIICNLVSSTTNSPHRGLATSPKPGSPIPYMVIKFS
jgi:hypothetical protein